MHSVKGNVPEQLAPTITYPGERSASVQTLHNEVEGYKYMYIRVDNTNLTSTSGTNL